jgi:hypothetical protein
VNKSWQVARIEFDWGQLILIVLDEVFFRLFPCVMSFGSESPGFRVGFFEPGLFGIEFEGVFVILKGFLKVTDFIEARASGKEGVDMFWVEFDDDGQIFDGKRDFADFFVGASHQVVSADVFAVDIKDSVTVVDGLMVDLFFHKG